jgi:Ca2+-binding RTX toxin-like protein
MPYFFGTGADEVIAPTNVSPTVARIGGVAPSQLTDAIYAGDGSDRVTGGGGFDHIDLGGGSDAAYWTRGDGNHTVDGGGDYDGVYMYGNNDGDRFRIAADGEQVRIRHGYADSAVVTNNVERLDINTRGGVDLIEIGNLSGTDVRNVYVNLAGSSAGTSSDGTLDQVVADLTAGADRIELVEYSGGGVTMWDGPVLVSVSNMDGLDSFTVFGLGGADVLDASRVTSAKLLLFGGDANDLLIAGGGINHLDGGQGSDTVSYEGSRSAVGVDLLFGATGAAFGDTYAGIENLTGSGFSDTLTGTDGVNVLKGLAGADTLDGRGGADTMQGGLGTDTYHVDNGGDRVIEEGSGTDSVVAYMSYTLGANLENLTLGHYSGNINGTGNGLANALHGNDAKNALTGKEGDDGLDGRGGNDIVNGGAGRDLVRGGLGADVLTGGAAPDTFFYKSAEETGIGAARDRITDFAVGDKIDVGNVDAAVGGWNNSFSLDQDGDFLSGEIRQRKVAEGLLIEFNIDLDAAEEMSILLVGREGALSEVDFVL